ncbi:uncharacterized protein TNCV_919841 [Trichonephila clavipes]|nr:uncharacterized protein TNCV_919841 [Trichonephila clavipes]
MLVQIDHATRYVVATPSASLAAHSVSDALHNNIILRYGPPNMYLSDREASFIARHNQRFLQKSHSFKAGDPVLYDWPKQRDHKLSPIFKEPFEIVRPVGTVSYEIKSTTQQNKFIKVVHVQYLRPYFKRNATTIDLNSADEENESH